MDYFKLFTGNSTLVWTFVHKLWFLRNTIAPSLFVQENMNMQWINLDCNSCCKMLFRLIFSWLLLLAITHTKVCDWFFFTQYSYHTCILDSILKNISSTALWFIFCSKHRIRNPTNWNRFPFSHQLHRKYFYVKLEAIFVNSFPFGFHLWKAIWN